MSEAIEKFKFKRQPQFFYWAKRIHWQATAGLVELPSGVRLKKEILITRTALLSQKPSRTGGVSLMTISRGLYASANSCYASMIGPWVSPKEDAHVRTSYQDQKVNSNYLDVSTNFLQILRQLVCQLSPCSLLHTQSSDQTHTLLEERKCLSA